MGARALWGLFALTLAAAPLAAASEIVSARYADPTARYDHAVLGDALEWGTLVLTLKDGRRVRIVLPETRVFEDTKPRLADLDGDGAPEVIVVESHLDLGARLSVYGSTGLIAATPHIGQRYRWLAPIGAADLDGDGIIELAYVDRPHLARTIRIWQFADNALSHAADVPGFTNHRIGETDIAGGIRDCGDGPEMVVASADWQKVMGVIWDGTTASSRTLGPHEGRHSFASALACR